jgi:predicted DNA-binding protein with PD1-like motif
VSYLLRVPEGAEIVGYVRQLLHEMGIESALLAGIGGLRRARLGYFDFAKKSYAERLLEGQLELVSLLGNAALSEQGVHVHLHACVAGQDYAAMAGHLLEGIVHPFVELGITPTKNTANRRFSRERGLYVLLEERP